MPDPTTEYDRAAAKAPIEIVTPAESAGSFGFLEAFSLDVLVGLSEPRKTIPSRYMYDEAGSRLFQRITELPEYYLTGCELEILKTAAGPIGTFVQDTPFNLVEFGAGHELKPSVLIESFLGHGLDFRYVPIDISRTALEELVARLDGRFPGLRQHGVVSEYFNGMRWLAGRDARRNLVLFLGSNIGNFNRAQARVFLRNLWNSLNDGDFVLIGFDLKKDIERLLSAYNDSAGVTAEFNLNVLRRINRELGGNFDPARFRHFGTYDVFSGAMESYLVSTDPQEVFVERIGRSFVFHAWEPIHTEYSYKYLESDIPELARDTGFALCRNFFDSRHWFVDSLWQVQKAQS
jgi:L-histidine N-alpha-methyltransferase